MDCYILDNLFRRNAVIDTYESFIWTERWQDVGDFELILDSSIINRDAFTVGTYLAIKNSYRVMVVNNVEDGTDDEGREVLRISGESLESVLKNRIYLFTIALSNPKAAYYNTPKWIINEVFDHTCRPGDALRDDDEILMLEAGSLLSQGDIPAYSGNVYRKQEPDILYNIIRKLCVEYDLGFRLIKNGDESELYFDAYTGDDRTSSQSANSHVIFSKDLDNLEATTKLNSIHKYRNVAYVWDELATYLKVVVNDGGTYYYSSGIDYSDVNGLIEDLDRRVVLIEPELPSDTDSGQVSDLLNQVGREILQQQRMISLFDGQVSQVNSYIYGTDYNLGDLIELRDQNGDITNKRVTEQIFVSDLNGERSYPTLASK